MTRGRSCDATKAGANWETDRLETGEGNNKQTRRTFANWNEICFCFGVIVSAPSKLTGPPHANERWAGNVHGIVHVAINSRKGLVTLANWGEPTQQPLKII